MKTDDGKEISRLDVAGWFTGKTVEDSFARITTGDYVSAGVLADGDYTLNCSTDKTLVLSETVYNDLMVQPSGVRLPAVGAPSWVSYKDSYVLAFGASATNTIYFSAQLPHTYKTGSNIEFHLHLTYPDANAGNSIWYFTYSWATITGTFPSSSNSGNVTIAAPAAADYHQIGQIMSSITGTGKGISSILLCSLARLGGDGSDSYGSDIYLVGLDFHHQIDTLGSRQETVK